MDTSTTQVRLFTCSVGSPTSALGMAFMTFRSHLPDCSCPSTWIPTLHVPLPLLLSLDICLSFFFVKQLHRERAHTSYSPPSEVYNSVVFSPFTWLCDQHLISAHFHYTPETPHQQWSLPVSLPPATGKHSAISFSGFTFSGYLT